MKKIYELEELTCPQCASEVASNLQKLDFIQEVHINYNTKQVEIISEKELSDNEVGLVINTVVSLSHCKKHSPSSDITEEFNVENIDCPNCALKVEEALNKEDNIIDAKVSFMNKKIVITHKDNVEVFETINRVLSKVEDGAYITNEHNHEHHHDGHCHEGHCNCGHQHSEKINFIDNIFKYSTDKILVYALMGAGLLFMVVGLILGQTAYEKWKMAAYITSYIMISYTLIFKAIRNIFKGQIFDENLLMIIASVGAIVVGEPIEAIMVVLLYKVGDFFQARAIRKSRDAIASLIDVHVDMVTLVSGDVVDIKDVLVGEEILVKVGERIPLDGVITEGITELNMQALTGESLPVLVKKGDNVLSGSINVNEVIKVQVTATDEESTVSKVLKLVEEASTKKSNTEQFITKFARIYTPIVILLSFLIFIIPVVILKQNAYDYLHRACMFLVISCPCALVISIPLGFFGGIGLASKNGILVKGGNYLEALTKTTNMVFDKTGTITKGLFYVAEINPIRPMSKADLVEIVAHIEAFSNHPIAKSIVNHYNDAIDKTRIKEVVEVTGKGIKGLYFDKQLLVGRVALLETYQINFSPIKSTGTVIYAALDGKYIGNIIIKDEIRSESAPLMASLKFQGIKTTMLTGDNEFVASEVSKEVGIDNCYASLMPDEKLAHLSQIINESGKGQSTVYVGDGINDTPSLKMADVGIAMGGIGSDAAKESADIVIMNDDLTKINSIIKISKFTHLIVVENVVFSLVVKILAMVLGGFGILGGLGMYIAVLSDVGVCLVTILNTLRILFKKLKK